MKVKEIELYLELFSDYLYNRNVYNYEITNMIIDNKSIIFSFVEISPDGLKSSTSLLIFTINHLDELTILNKYGKDCIYDYLSENDMTLEECHIEMQKYKEKIKNYKERYWL